MIRRGEIWWAELPEPEGTEPGKRRPVVIVSADRYNDSTIDTVIVASVTTNLRRAGAPGNVILRRHRSRLPRTSVVNVSQILTVDKSRLTERVGVLDRPALEEVDEGLRQVLAL